MRRPPFYSSHEVHSEFTRRALPLFRFREKVQSVIQDKLSWSSTKKAKRRSRPSSQAGTAAQMKPGGRRGNQHRIASKLRSARRNLCTEELYNTCEKSSVNGRRHIHGSAKLRHARLLQRQSPRLAVVLLSPHCCFATLLLPRTRRRVRPLRYRICSNRFPGSRHLHALQVRRASSHPPRPAPHTRPPNLAPSQRLPEARLTAFLPRALPGRRHPPHPRRPAADGIPFLSGHAEGSSFAG